MGNSVSAAEKIAIEILHKDAEPKLPNDHHHKHIKHSSSDEPPPECPMHGKMGKPIVVDPAKEECPVGYSKDDINPLNMVRIICKYC